jgi:hypothetical protein
VEDKCESHLVAETGDTKTGREPSGFWLEEKKGEKRGKYLREEKRNLSYDHINP